MNKTDEQQEIQQKLLEINAASNAFNAADRALREAKQHGNNNTTKLTMAEREKVIEQYVTAKSWLYAHTDGILYDSATDSFILKQSSNPS